MADLQEALRQLKKAPGFTTTAVITLALGIGATTAIFTLVHQVMLKSLPVVKPEERPPIPRFIRKFAVPIILGWIALIALLSMIVPDLDEVGKMRSVSMAPDDAQSVIATKRMGAIFNEYKSNSSVMIVLEGQKPLGADAHHFYNTLIGKLRQDIKHVQHVQDFWGDPLTAAGSQSTDNKAALVQVYLAGDQGEHSVG